MTIKKAIKISIEVWTYFYENPHVKRKVDLPEKLIKKIENSNTWCPLCDVFNWCNGCPLYVIYSIGYMMSCPDYKDWRNAKSNRRRKHYAGIILEKLKAEYIKKHG